MGGGGRVYVVAVYFNTPTLTKTAYLNSELSGLAGETPQLQMSQIIRDGRRQEEQGRQMRTMTIHAEGR